MRFVVGGPDTVTWPIQLLAAACLGFAALNWASRGSLVGGIYGRPLMAANFAHFLIAGLVLVRRALSGSLEGAMWLLLATFALLAAAHGLRLFLGPPRLEMETARTGNA